MSNGQGGRVISTGGSRNSQPLHPDLPVGQRMLLDAASYTNSIRPSNRAKTLTNPFNVVNRVTALNAQLDNTLWHCPSELRLRG